VRKPAGGILRPSSAEAAGIRCVLRQSLWQNAYEPLNPAVRLPDALEAARNGNQLDEVRDISPPGEPPGGGSAKPVLACRNPNGVQQWLYGENARRPPNPIDSNCNGRYQAIN